MSESQDYPLGYPEQEARVPTLKGLPYPRQR